MVWCGVVWPENKHMHQSPSAFQGGEHFSLLQQKQNETLSDTSHDNDELPLFLRASDHVQMFRETSASTVIGVRNKP